jgi:outer membrane protein assembly factor BamA
VLRYVGRVLLLGPAFFLSASGCRHVPPKLNTSPPTIVEEVRVEAFDVLPADALDDLRQKLPLRSGTALTDEAEKSAGDAAVEILQNHGYPFAQVSIVREPVGQNRTRVTVRANPGTMGFFSAIEIAGNRTVDDRIIRRRLAYAPGDLFRRSSIERSQQRIGALGLFKSVAIRADKLDARPAEVPTVVTVEERSPWRWNLSLGYAAGEQLGIGARVSHLNFLGAARRLDLEGRVSRIDRQAAVVFTQTDAWHPSLSLSAEARHWELDEHAFYVLSRGGEAAAAWRWSQNLTTTVSYASALERSRVDSSLELLEGLQDGMLNAWSIDVDHRTTSHVVMVHVEQAGRWLPGTFNYSSVVADARRYRSLLDNRLILAGRVRYGSIDPMSGEGDIPLLKRFFLGGSGEMRGWGRYEVSPLSETGTAVGGKSMLAAAAEARFPIFRRMRGAVFIEGGNVWQQTWSAEIGDLLYDAGPGLRIDTPFGLLRFDFGYQLKVLQGLRINGQPQKHRWRVNFGIGEAF